jgi:hypothetical protein
VVINSHHLENMDEMKIRGKRRRPVAQKPSNDPPLTRGRPMKPASELAVSRKKTKMSQQRPGDVPPLSSAEELKKQTSLSCLESLPPELAQQIFFHALDVNMVKSSPIISKMLSTDSTYNLLILFAFFDDDGINPVETKYFKPATYRELPIAEKIRLQEGILSCRWCTLERVKASLPTLTRLKIVQEWHKEHNVTKSSVSDPSPEVGSSSTRPPSLPPLEEHSALELYFSVRPWRTMPGGKIQRDETDYILGLKPYNVIVNEHGFSSKQRSFGWDFEWPSTLAVRHIPDRLLTGKPWIPEKLEYLKLLREGNRFLQRDFTLRMSPEAIFSGMKDAIEENNRIALLLLLDLHDFRFHIAPSTLGNITVKDKNPHNQRLTNPHSHPIPLSLFHLAAKRNYEDSHVLLALLARAGIDSVPHDDHIITKWALQASESSSGSALGKWLLEYMEGGLLEQLFSHGAAWQAPEILWAGQESFAQQVGYEAGFVQRYYPFSVEVESGNYT